MEILLFAICLLCFIAPFLRGLYFEAYLLPFQIAVYGTFILWVFLKWRKKEKKILLGKTEYLMLGLVFAYILSSIKAVSVRDALSESFKYLMYFIIFIMLSDFMVLKKYRECVVNTFISAYIVVSLIGLDGLLGQKFTAAFNSLLQKLNVDFALNGLVYENRIGSVIQYPNALAACLCALMLITISLYLGQQKISGKLLYACASYIFMVTMFLTVSRGIVLVIPVAVILFILFLPQTLKAEGFLFLIFLTITALPVFFKAYQKDPYSWFYIIFGIIVICGISFAIKYAIKALSFIKMKTVLTLLGCFSVTVGIISAIAVSIPEPLSLDAMNNKGTQDVRKRVVLEPGKSYTLKFQVEAEASDESKPVYYVEIANKNEGEVVQSKETPITRLEGKVTNGQKAELLKFSVPMDSKMLNIHFGNISEDAKVTFYEAKIYDAVSDKLVDTIILKYKYVPQSLAIRFEAFKAADTGISRLVYYKDAVKMIKDRALLGAGGGAWAVLYPAYQSMYYWTNEPHSYIFKVGVETGVLGVLLFISILSAALYGIFKRKKQNKGRPQHEIALEAGAIAAIAAIVLHAFIDLDFSIPSVFLIFWMLLSILNAYERQIGKEQNIDKKSKNGLINYVQPVFLVGLCLAAAVVSSLFITSHSYIQKAHRVTGNNAAEYKLQNLKKAIDTDPFSPLVRIEYSNLLVQSGGSSKDVLYKAYSQVAKAEELSKHNSKDMAKIAAFYLAVGDAGRGLTAVDRSTALSPLWVDSWYQKLDAYRNVTLALFQKGQTENAMKMVDKSLGIIEELKAVNVKAQAPVLPDKDILRILEKMMYVKNRISVEKSINMDRIVFYGINGMDVDSNGIPDQWKAAAGTHLTYNISDNTIRINKSAEAAKASIVSAWPIALEENTSYRIEIELDQNSVLDDIAIKIEGINNDKEMPFKKEGNRVIADFQVLKGFKQSDSNMEINFSGNCKIREILITKM